MGLKFGLSQVDITPDLQGGLDLAGLRSQEMRRANRLFDRLRVRVAWFCGGSDLVLVNGDVLYFPDEMCAELSAWVAERFGTEARQVVFNATHTHCAPSLGGRFLDGARVEPSYVALVQDAIRKALTLAHDDRQEADVWIGTRLCRVGVNRRKRILDTRALLRGRLKTMMANMPNHRGAVDNDLVVVKVIRNGAVSAFLLNYGCHANARLMSAVSGDFPGVAQQAFESLFQRRLPVFFLQGFSGNVRPLVRPSLGSLMRSPRNLVSGLFHGRPFEKGVSEGTVARIASQFVDAVTADGAFQKAEWVSPAREVRISLPLKATAPAGSHSVPINIRRIDFGRDSSFLCVPGEVFCEYGIRLKQRLAPRRVIPLGCTGGMVGYIPTAEAVREGGYEVEKSYRLFGMSDPFDESIERLFMESALSLFMDSPPNGPKNALLTDKRWR